MSIDVRKHCLFFQGLIDSFVFLGGLSKENKKTTKK